MGDPSDRGLLRYGSFMWVQVLSWARRPTPTPLQAYYESPPFDTRQEVTSILRSSPGENTQGPAGGGTVYMISVLSASPRLNTQGPAGGVQCIQSLC